MIAAAPPLCRCGTAVSSLDTHVQATDGKCARASDTLNRWEETRVFQSASLQQDLIYEADEKAVYFLPALFPVLLISPSPVSGARAFVCARAFVLFQPDSCSFWLLT